MTKDAYYFPHDANARHDPRIMALIAELSPLGYAYFFMLIEILREQSDYSLKQSHSNALAIEWQVDPKEVSAILEKMERLELIEIADEGVIKSPSLCRRMASFDEKKAKRSNAGKKGAAMLWQSHGNRLTKDGKGEKSREDKTKKSRKNFSAAEVIAVLKTTPRYQHINIDLEFQKASKWVEEHPGRVFTKGFFTKWLNRIEPSLETGCASALPRV